MSAPLVQAQYDELETVAQRFGQHAQAVTTLQNQLRQSVQALEQGGWEGQGAAAFFAEMNGTVMPGVTRLGSALEAAQTITLEIKALLEKADEEAAAPFRGDGSAPTAIDGAGPAQVDGTPAAPGPGQTNGTPTAPSPPAQPQSLIDAIGERLSAVNRFAVLPLFAQNLAQGRLLDLLKIGGKAGGLSKFLAGSKILGAASKFLGPINLAAGIWNFAEDPSVVNGASMGASGLGLWGAFSSTPAGLLAASFSAGYTIGEVIVPDSWKDALGDKLTDWDPLDLGSSPRNYPNTTIKDFARHGREMPVDTARHVYVGLMEQQGAKKANEFAREYAQRNNKDINEIVPWVFRGGFGF